MKIKIGYISTSKLDDKSAWSGTISYLADNLSNRYTIVPIIISNRYNKTWHNLCDALHLSSFFYKVPNIVRKLLIRIKIYFSKADLLFAPAASELIGYDNSITNKPIVYLSDATYHLMINYYIFDSNKNKNKYFDQLERNALNQSKAVILASNWAASDAVSHYHIPFQKIHVLPFPPYLPDCYQKKHIKNDFIRLLLVGVDWKRKGIDIAIETVRILNSIDSRKYTLTIIGVEKPEYCYDENVVFVGRLNKADPKDLQLLVYYYQNSDIFILPTQAECAGIVFSEAAMYGLPVVTYATGGVESYVKNKQTGYCLPMSSPSNLFAQCIKSMLDDNQYDSFSNNARQAYEDQFSWTAWLQHFDKIVNTIL